MIQPNRINNSKKMNNKKMNSKKMNSKKNSTDDDSFLCMWLTKFMSKLQGSTKVSTLLETAEF